MGSLAYLFIKISFEVTKGHSWSNMGKSLEVNKGHSWSNMAKRAKTGRISIFVESIKSMRRNEAFDVRFPKKVCLKVIQGKIELHLDISFTYFGI